MTTVADPITADLCKGTPTLSVLDNRGLAVRTLEYNRSAPGAALDERMTLQSFTNRGHLQSSIDPRLLAAREADASVPPNFRYRCALSGQPLQTLSQDAGEGMVLYDIEGAPVWHRDGKGQEQRFTYDALHRIASVTEQSPGVASRVSERFFYGEAEAGASDANLRGRVVRHYDTAGRTTTSSFSVTAQVLTTEQQFLIESQPRSDWAGSDPAQWEKLLDATVHTSRWRYNAQGVAVESTDARGNRQTLRLNLSGQLAASSLRLAGQSNERTLLRTITYSASNQVLREEAGNGVLTEYEYEPETQRLSLLKTTRPAQQGRTALLQELRYDYDPVGNLLTISDAAIPSRFTRNQRVDARREYHYDALYQLCQASGRENANAGQQEMSPPSPIIPIANESELTNYSRTYTYDRGGNLTRVQHTGRQSYTLDMVVASTSNRAVRQSGGLMPGDVNAMFDACGNLKQLANGQPLAWDGLNQLQRTTQIARNGPDDDQEEYRYDGNRQRVSKRQTSLTGNTTRTTRVLYLPGLELRQTEQTQAGTTTPIEVLQVIVGGAAGRQQVRGLHWETGRPAAIENDQLRYSLDDQIGSVSLELDGQADLLSWEEYYPYGGTAVWSGRNDTETKYKYVRYSGKERDVSGLYYYGIRYYAPWLQRWLNPDPAGTVDGLNLFRMVRNNPIRWTDEEGNGPKEDEINAQIITDYAELLDVTKIEAKRLFDQLYSMQRKKGVQQLARQGSVFVAKKSLKIGASAGGAALGGAVGSLIPVPVVGTVAGATIGAVVGGLIAGIAAEKTLDKVLDKAELQQGYYPRTSEIRKKVNRANDRLAMTIGKTVADPVQDRKTYASSAVNSGFDAAIELSAGAIADAGGFMTTPIFELGLHIYEHEKSEAGISQDKLGKILHTLRHMQQKIRAGYVLAKGAYTALGKSEVQQQGVAGRLKGLAGKGVIKFESLEKKWLKTSNMLVGAHTLAVELAQSRKK